MVPSGRNRRLLPLVVATAVALLVLDAASFGPIVGLRRTVLSIGHPIGAVLALTVSPLHGMWNGAVHYDDVAEDNHRLRRRVAELEGRIDGQGDVEAELRALMTATEIDYLGDVERLTARVVSDRRTDLERIVEIDRGRGSGVVAGMPVVTGHGLVGVVELVSGDRSVIRLMTDPEVAVGVRSSHGLGLVTGRRDGELVLEPTPELVESIRLGAVADGQRFVTSGIDRSLYPPGIPVGTLVVSGVGTGGPGGGGLPADSPLSPAGPSLAADEGGGEDQPAGGRSGRSVVHDIEVSLEPLADLDQLGYVTVLLIGRTP